MSAVIRRRRMLLSAVPIGWAAGLPAALAHEYFTPYFTVVHPWTRASAAGATTARIGMSFLDVTQADRLIGAQSPLAQGAELIASDGVALSGIAITAGQTTTLSEIGIHLRLRGLTQGLEIGREYPLTLVFEKAGALKASFLVDFPAPA